MYPRSIFCAKNKKNITIFHLKIIIFRAVKNHCVLHGRVFVMAQYIELSFDGACRMGMQACACCVIEIR